MSTAVVASRYLAELAKFRLAPPSTVLLRLKVLLDDFTGNAVDGAAALVESAGRFLLRLPGECCVTKLPVSWLSVWLRVHAGKGFKDLNYCLYETEVFTSKPRYLC